MSTKESGKVNPISAVLHNPTGKGVILQKEQQVTNEESVDLSSKKKHINESTSALNDGGVGKFRQQIFNSTVLSKSKPLGRKEKSNFAEGNHETCNLVEGNEESQALEMENINREIDSLSAHSLSMEGISNHHSRYHGQILTQNPFALLGKDQQQEDVNDNWSVIKEPQPVNNLTSTKVNCEGTNKFPIGNTKAVKEAKFNGKINGKDRRLTRTRSTNLENQITDGNFSTNHGNNGGKEHQLTITSGVSLLTTATNNRDSANNVTIGARGDSSKLGSPAKGYTRGRPNNQSSTHNNPRIQSDTTTWRTNSSVREWLPHSGIGECTSQPKVPAILESKKSQAEGSLKPNTIHQETTKNDSPMALQGQPVIRNSDDDSSTKPSDKLQLSLPTNSCEWNFTDGSCIPLKLSTSDYPTSSSQKHQHNHLSNSTTKPSTSAKPRKLTNKHTKNKTNRASPVSLDPKLITAIKQGPKSSFTSNQSTHTTPSRSIQEMMNILIDAQRETSPLR